MATKTVKKRLKLNQTKEMTLKQLYNEYMEYSKARNFRPQTLENNEFNFIVLSDYFGEDSLIEDIVLGAINGYINYLLDERKVKVSDLDLHNRMLYLRDTKSYKLQTIYLSQSIIKILHEWLKITQLKGDSLFEELNARLLKINFRTYARSRGVKTSLHILRHTYACYLLKVDINPVTIKALLCHQSLEVRIHKQWIH